MSSVNLEYQKPKQEKRDKAISHISEIIKNFDITAIQETKDDLGGLEKLQRVLGKWTHILECYACGVIYLKPPVRLSLVKPTPRVTAIYES